MTAKLTVILGLFLLCGCNKGESRIGSDIERILVTKKFNEILTDNYHSIAKHRGSPGPDIVLSTAKIYDKYIIKMSFPFKKVDSNGNFTDADKFKFQISEHSYDSGRWVSEGIGELSLAEWNGVATIDEIFSLIGVIPEKNSPIKELVENFGAN